MKPVAVVLGSGGARGLSFLGVLRVLTSHKFPIAQVIGCSMGALLGAAFCAGVPIDDLVEQACRWRRRDFVRFSLLGPSLFSNAGIRKLAERLIPVRTFEELNVPLTVVCTDLQSGEPVVFSRGELVPPVVGSSLAAGIFDPVVYQGRYLVDGGYVDPVPARLCPSGLVRLVVDPSVPPNRRVNAHLGRSFRHVGKVRSMFAQALKSIDILLYRYAREANRDCVGVYIFPQLGDRAFFDFRDGHLAVASGEEAMREKLGELFENISRGD